MLRVHVRAVWCAQAVYKMILDHVQTQLPGCKVPTLDSLHKYKDTVRKSISMANACAARRTAQQLAGGSARTQQHDSPKLIAKLKGRQKAVRPHMHLYPHQP